jgi:hypothetical protein
MLGQETVRIGARVDNDIGRVKGGSRAYNKTVYKRNLYQRKKNKFLSVNSSNITSLQNKLCKK